MRSLEDIVKYLRGAIDRAEIHVGQREYERAYGRLRAACFVAATSIEMFIKIESVRQEVSRMTFGQPKE